MYYVLSFHAFIMVKVGELAGAEASLDLNIVP